MPWVNHDLSYSSHHFDIIGLSPFDWYIINNWLINWCCYCCSKVCDKYKYRLVARCFLIEFLMQHCKLCILGHSVLAWRSGNSSKPQISEVFFFYSATSGKCGLLEFTIWIAGTECPKYQYFASRGSSCFEFSKCNACFSHVVRRTRPCLE
jgi:hypothetical protein